MMLTSKFHIYWGSLLALTNMTLVQATELKTGYFIDSPVTGLFYKTSSNISGFTQQGAFSYQEGDIVSFYLGRDDNGYLLNRVSSQEVLTPNLISSLPSRSLNLTRLLLSLDSTPENRREILLLSDWLAKPDIQKHLKKLDLTALNQEMLSSLNIDLVSAQEAVNHLSESQEYIAQNFASEQVLFSPLNKRMKTVIVKKRDLFGRICIYDLRLVKHPRYRPPYGAVTFEITPKMMVEFPDIGDRFRGCFLEPNDIEKIETLYTPLADIWDEHGLSQCAKSGCTRNDLNGFVIDSFNDDGDWKHRSLALNFDPVTQLLMEKTQGLGRTERIRHPNLIEQIWFTYPQKQYKQLSYEGIWQETTYQSDQIDFQCLLISNGEVKTTLASAPISDEGCPSEIQRYQRDVSRSYGDMWWVSVQKQQASLEQLNITVRWYPESHAKAKLTSWEYLPAGEEWDKGILYRYQQTIVHNPDGSEQLKTHSISEYTKITGVNR
ncbi:chromosome partitioning protein ParA [Vibrio fluminensis]|uniref:chromosome partitioning protein ParA n=1 Tax=Vibrio fluminensis TaxID=2783614 RepID=UPI001E31B780|nr:chromosome partitioning protein ParA [Vibrio fluminensis]